LPEKNSKKPKNKHRRKEKKLADAGHKKGSSANEKEKGRKVANLIH